VHFAPIFWRQKITTPNITEEKQLNSLSYEKCVRKNGKMLVKLTKGVNFTNVFEQLFRMKVLIVALMFRKTCVQRQPQRP